MWSRWAWLTTMASIRRGSKGRLALGEAASAPWPWKSPASRRIRAPAASSRCIEPVTWPAAPQKVSFAVPIGLLVETASTVNGQQSTSTCPEDPVPRVPQPGQNVTLRVELAIERGGVHRHVGVGIEHRLDPLRRRDEAEKPDPGGARGTQLAHRRRRRAPGGEHRIEDEE